MNLITKITNKQRAFTLLEVLVALAVLTLGLGTVIKVTAGQASQLAYLKDKTIALWVANNKANEVQLQKTWPSTGISTGRKFMADQEWAWRMKVSNTVDKDLRRLDIEVKRVNEEGEPVIRYISFAGKKITTVNIR